ncbi:TPA: AAA family ATPase [Acinetobacter baumannii]|nr:AAA family ATPase [Acinetobacter baumannii]
MLNSFSLDKYKGFGDQQLIELKPITLLYGENNSGKSSLARFLPSLKENYKYNHTSFYPIGMLGKANKNFIYGNSRESYFELNYDDMNIKYSFHIINEDVIINQIVIKDIEGNVETFNLDLDSFNYCLELNPQEKFTIKNMIPLLNHSNLCEKLYDKFEKISKGVFWISPLRYIPKPIEVFNNIKMSKESDGADAIQILASSVKGNKKVFKIVDQWIGKIFQQKIDLGFSAVGDYQVFTTNISPISFENIKVPIAESGMGVSQILPILVLCAQLIVGEIKEESYLIFENPELHLHDALHKELAQIFAEVISKVNSTKIIIETHSEVLLQAIQLEVIKNTINFESVSINWIKKIGEKNIVERVNINNDGQLDENWPATAFQTSNNLAKKHVIELLARGQE